MTTTLDDFGRLVIPSKIRKHLGISASTNLSVEEVDNTIVITPLPDEHAVVEIGNVLIYTGHCDADLTRLHHDDRTSRDSSFIPNTPK